jgi:hypothetical protein
MEEAKGEGEEEEEEEEEVCTDLIICSWPSTLMDESTDSCGVGHVTLVAKQPRVGKDLRIIVASLSHRPPHSVRLP